MRISASTLALSALLFAKDIPALATEQEVHAYLDAYYSHNFNRPDNSSQSKILNETGNPAIRLYPSGSNLYRNFDIQNDQFSLALAEISYIRRDDELSIKVDLDYGDIADMTHTNSSGVDETSKGIGQANITYSPKSFPQLTFQVGKMPTHMGFEVTKSKDNWQYSRSFLFSYGIPYWHQGGSLQWRALPEIFSATFFLYNGWNNSYENNGGKTLGLQLALTPSKQWGLTYNGIGGPERENSSDNRIVHEWIANWSPSEVLSLALDAIHGEEAGAFLRPNGERSSSRWQAIELAARLRLSDEAYVSPRFERYWDYQGSSTGRSQTLGEWTLTGAYRVHEGFELRMEARQDNSTTRAFLSHSGMSEAQSTLSFSSLVNF